MSRRHPHSTTSSSPIKHFDLYINKLKTIPESDSMEKSSHQYVIHVYTSKYTPNHTKTQYIHSKNMSTQTHTTNKHNFLFLFFYKKNFRRKTNNKEYKISVRQAIDNLIKNSPILSKLDDNDSDMDIDMIMNSSGSDLDNDTSINGEKIEIWGVQPCSIDISFIEFG